MIQTDEHPRPNVQRYLTFGLAEIYFPRDVAVQVSLNRIKIKLVDFWRQGEGQSADPRNLLTSFLDRWYDRGTNENGFASKLQQAVTDGSKTFKNALSSWRNRLETNISEIKSKDEREDFNKQKNSQVQEEAKRIVGQVSNLIKDNFEFSLVREALAIVKTLQNHVSELTNKTSAFNNLLGNVQLAYEKTENDLKLLDVDEMSGEAIFADTDTDSCYQNLLPEHDRSTQLALVSSKITEKVGLGESLVSCLDRGVIDEQQLQTEIDLVVDGLFGSKSLSNVESAVKRFLESYSLGDRSIRLEQILREGEPLLPLNTTDRILSGSPTSQADNAIDIEQENTNTIMDVDFEDKNSPNQPTEDIETQLKKYQVYLEQGLITQAFFTSLTAIACSSILIGINLRCNTNFAKSLLISSLEDYLDNIYKVEIEGYSRLDLAVDRMVKQQEDFLYRFHEKVGEVLEITLGKAANQLVVANQGFQNNVDNMVSRFNDVSGSLASSTNSFQDSVATLQSQVNTVTNIIPQFQSSADKLERGSNIYLEGATKIEKSKFSENLGTTTLNLANITTDLATTQKSFSKSTAFLGNQVHKISESHQQATSLAEQVYSQLQQASSQLQDSASGFIKASETIVQTDFADKLASATKELTNIPQQFNESTAILHQSTNSLGKAIDSINISAVEITNLVQKVNNLNQYSSKLLESSNNKIELKTASLERVKSELNTIADKLHKYQEQVNIGLEKFGSKLLTSFEEQTNKNTQEVNNLTNEVKKLVARIGENKTELTKLTSRLEYCFNNFNRISDRSIDKFEQRSTNNVREMEDLTNQLKELMFNLTRIPETIKNNLNEQSTEKLESYEQKIKEIEKEIDNTFKNIF